MNILWSIVSIVSIVLFIALCAISCYLVYLTLSSKSWIEANKKINRLANEWILLKPFAFLIKKIVREPIIPPERNIQIGNCIIYLAHLSKNISKERLLLEIICYIDLYYHQKRSQFFACTPNVSYYTAISEEAYIQAQWLLKSKQSLDVMFKTSIDIYLQNIRWSSNCILSYNPNDSVIYFTAF